MGSQYVVTLNAVNAATGDSLDNTQSEASSKEQVLKALGDIDRLLLVRLLTFSVPALPSLGQQNAPILLPC